MSDNDASEPAGPMLAEDAPRTRGLHWLLAAVCVIADMAGAGIVALPVAMVMSDYWIGLVILFVMTFATMFSGALLGRCWTMLLELRPVYRSRFIRKPYAEMGNLAMGPKLKNLVSVCIVVTQFMVTVVFLLLTAKNVRDLIDHIFGVVHSDCLILLIIAVCLLPVSFLKSTADFWHIIAFGMLTTAAAVVFMLVGAAHDYSGCAPQRGIPEFHARNAFLAIGTILFLFGGHTAFPTIQHDMRHPQDFTKTIVVSFAALALFYVPIGTAGFFTYGDSLRDSMINSIQTGWIQRAANLMITAHCLLTLTLIANPLNQEVEEFFNVPQEFGWKRVAVRSGVMAAALFTAESIPNFGLLLDLVGGLLATLTSLVFPVLFYLYLRAALRKRETSIAEETRPATFKEVLRYTDKPMLIACVAVLAIGILGGGAATFSAIRGLYGGARFVAPCYVSALHAQEPAVNVTRVATNCCGASQMVTTFVPPELCSPPNYHYYD